jgi:hypothetical protein
MSSTLRGGIAVRFGNGTQAVQLSASSRELLAARHWRTASA